MPQMVVQLDAYDGLTSRPTPVFCTTVGLVQVCAPWSATFPAPSWVTRSTALTPIGTPFSWNFYQEQEVFYHGRPDPNARHNVLVVGTHMYVSSVAALGSNLGSIEAELAGACAP
jgi:hypothetical protein